MPTTTAPHRLGWTAIVNQNRGTSFAKIALCAKHHPRLLIEFDNLAGELASIPRLRRAAARGAGGFTRA